MSHATPGISTWSLAAAAALAAGSAGGQTIKSLSADALPRSGRLIIEGEGFGAAQGDGEVVIGGSSAIVTRWHDDRIHAYVPERAAPGETDVVVVTETGRSDSAPIWVDEPVWSSRDHHRVLWTFQTDGYSLGRRVDRGPNGTLYTSDFSGLYALSPEGQLQWFTPNAGGGRPVTFGSDGTIYTGSSLVTALNPDGTVKWVFENPRPGLDLAAGPNIGPDGNIYAAQDTDGDPNALGVFALDPDGELLWSTGMDYPMISLRGPSYTDIVFDTDRMYITIYRRLSRPPTVRTYDYDGDLLWYTGDMPLPIGGPPKLHPNGTLIFNWAQTGIQALDRDGNQLWIADHPVDGQLLLPPRIGADGTIYVADWSGPDWWGVDEDGDTLWLGPQPGYDMILGTAINPDQSQLLASGAETFGVPNWVSGYDATGSGELLWRVDLPAENGLNQSAGSLGTFSPDGSIAYFSTGFPSDAFYGYVYAVDTQLSLDCDGDGVLDINDNCECEFNPSQQDSDADGIGDACDPFNLPDACEDALPICPGVTAGNSLGATNDGGSSCSPNSSINKDVWYAYSPLTSGTVTIDGRDSNYSFFLSAHSGCPGTVQNEIACGFDNYQGVWPSLTFDVVGGETYYIRVNGFNAVEMSSFQLTLDGPACEPQRPTARDVGVQTQSNADVEVALDAIDDGFPAGTLAYFIGSLPYNGTLFDPGTGAQVEDVPYALSGGTVIYSPDGSFAGVDGFAYYADDGGSHPSGGASNIASAEVGVGWRVLHEFLVDDADPGFTTTGNWAFGQPTGGGSHNGDPTGGFTGSNVYGYNLQGDYENNMPARYLTTPPLDFSEAFGVTMRFQKWLAIENASFDHAEVQIRSQGGPWVSVWDHTNSTNVSPTSWELVEYDVSTVADGQAGVQVRWVMGSTDSSETYAGWNIDDIEFVGFMSNSCLGDFDSDGSVNTGDVLAFLNAWNAQQPAGDFDGNGLFNSQDVLAFLNAWNAGCD